jgi:hypothetical protein
MFWMPALTVWTVDFAVVFVVDCFKVEFVFFTDFGAVVAGVDGEDVDDTDSFDGVAPATVSVDEVVLSTVVVDDELVAFLLLLPPQPASTRPRRTPAPMRRLVRPITGRARRR